MMIMDNVEKEGEKKIRGKIYYLMS